MPVSSRPFKLVAARGHGGLAVALAAGCLALPPTAQARTSWTICDYEVQAVRLDTLLTVRLVRPHGALPADCPAAAGEKTFTPETLDYQQTLPRRQWPRPGHRALLRYRYLDGFCKDRGPCRIKHHSLLPAR